VGSCSVLVESHGTKEKLSGGKPFETLTEVEGPSPEVRKLSLEMGRGFAPSMDTIAVIGEKILQSNCKL
jgi:hypothetical protein